MPLILWGNGVTNKQLSFPVSLNWTCYVTIGYDGFADTPGAVETFAVKEFALNSIYLISSSTDERSAKYLVIGA